MADTTPNLGLPLIDLTEPDADTLAEGAAKLRAALTTLDTVYQQLANSLQSPDAGTLGGQTLAQVLALANAAGILPVAKGGTGATDPAGAIASLGIDTYVATQIAALVGGAPAQLDALNEFAAALDNDANFSSTISGQIGTIQADITGLQSDVTALQSGGNSIAFFAAGDPLPTSDQGPIWHAAYNSIMTWQVFDANGANYIGYASVEIGRPSMDGQPTPRAGYFKRNGDSWSQGAYEALWHWALHTGRVVALGSWTQGESVFADNGDGTFRLPDTRSEFERAWDDGRGVDSGRAFGSWAADAYKSHSHTTPFAGGASAAINRYLYQMGNTNYYGATNSTNASGGAETRPRSVAHLADIKF